jgi:CubicO group peptidase (beta-lactamase class C family)
MLRATSRLAVALALIIPATIEAQTIASDEGVVEALEVARIWLDAQVDYERLPAISAAIVHNQELVWSGAMGMADIGDGRAAASNTLYSICSISKLFTSIGIMQLRDRGLLDLRDPVSTHLPFYDLAQKFPESTPVTVEGLLTHSAGLPREADYPYWSGPDFAFPTKDEVIARLNGQEMLHPSRTQYQYSNLGLSLAGYIIEEITGQSYHDYVREHILDPLGMADTYSDMPVQHVGGQLATGYGGLTREGVRNAADFFEARGIAPAAGYASTVDDLAKFAMWQFRLRGDREEVLHAYTLAEMQRVHFATPGSNSLRGLGFSVSARDDDTFVGHGGSCPGFRTTFSMQNEDKIATIAFVNATANAGKYANGVYDLVADAITDAVASRAAVTDDGHGEDGGENGNEGNGSNDRGSDMQEVGFARYVGTYTGGLGGNESVIVNWKGSIALLSLPTDDPRGSLGVLRHVEGDTFRRVDRDGELGTEVIFETDAEGRVTRMLTPPNFRTRVR